MKSRRFLATAVATAMIATGVAAPTATAETATPTVQVMAQTNEGMTAEDAAQLSEQLDSLREGSSNLGFGSEDFKEDAGGAFGKLFLVVAFGALLIGGLSWMNFTHPHGW